MATVGVKGKQNNWLLMFHALTFEHRGHWRMAAYCIMRHSTTSSCQSAATSEIVKRCCSQVYSL